MLEPDSYPEATPLVATSFAQNAVGASVKRHGGMATTVKITQRGQSIILTPAEILALSELVK